MKNVRNTKSIKRLAGYIMAGTLAFGVGITSLPASVPGVQAATVKVADDAAKIKDNTSYEAYQVFKGTNADGKLTDIEWGDGVNSAALLAALATDPVAQAAGITTTSSAEDVAAVIAKIDSTAAEKLAKAVYAHKGTAKTALTAGETATISDGYYLIVDVTSGVKANNAALLRVVESEGTITIGQKTDYPEVEKKVEENDTNSVVDGGYGAQYNDVADYTIGDAVNFHLIGTVPNMSKYDTYKYEFHDTLSTGLDSAKNVKVYLSDSKTLDTSAATDVTDKFTITAEGQKLDVTTSDLKAIVGDSGAKYVIVSYDSALNSKATIGLDGNVNEVYLTYSNNPDQSGSGENTPTNDTPKDYNIVFTYKVQPTKVDGSDETVTLPGAEFKLKNEKGEYAEVEDGIFKGWGANGTTLVSGEDGLFEVAGLDEGTYYLEETKAPTGYNKLKEAVKVVVEATTDNTQTWESQKASDVLTKLTIDVDDKGVKEGTVDNGTVTLDIANNQGSTLPETGGVGRSILYTLGASLVAAVGAIFGLKKRRA